MTRALVTALTAGYFSIALAPTLALACPDGDKKPKSAQVATTGIDCPDGDKKPKS